MRLNANFFNDWLCLDSGAWAEMGRGELDGSLGRSNGYKGSLIVMRFMIFSKDFTSNISIQQ